MNPSDPSNPSASSNPRLTGDAQLDEIINRIAPMSKVARLYREQPDWSAGLDEILKSDPFFQDLRIHTPFVVILCKTLYTRGRIDQRDQPTTLPPELLSELNHLLSLYQVQLEALLPGLGDSFKEYESSNPGFSGLFRALRVLPQVEAVYYAGVVKGVSVRAALRSPEPPAEPPAAPTDSQND